MSKPILYASSGASEVIVQGPGTTPYPFGTAMSPLSVAFGTPPSVQCAGTISKAYILDYGSTINVNAHLRMTLDGVATSVDVVILAGQSGLFVDDSNTITIPDDSPHLVEYYIEMDTGAVNPFNSTNYGVYGCLFTAANGSAISRLGNWTAFPNLGPVQNAGTTEYLSLVGNPIRYTDPDSANFHINFSGVLSKFAFNPANYLNTLDGDAHAILQKNGVDTAVDILIPQGGSDVWIYDTTTTVSCAPGDYFRWKLVAGGTTGTLQAAGSALNVESTGGFACQGSYGATRTFSHPNISYPNICGYITDGTLGEWPLYARTQTAFSGLGCQVIANTNAGNAYLRSYVNGTGVGNQVALIPPLQIGHFFDADPAHIDLLDDGDYIEGQMDMSAAGNINIQVTVIDYTLGISVPIPPLSGSVHQFSCVDGSSGAITLQSSSHTRVFSDSTGQT